MSRTLTDFSQLSKGMLRKSEPVVEVLSRAEAQRRGGGVTKFQVGVVVNFGMSTLKEVFLRFVNNFTEPQLRASAPLREDNPTATSIANICF